MEFCGGGESQCPPPPSLYTTLCTICVFVLYIQTTSQRLESHPLFNQMTEEEQNEMMDGIEKHLMTSIYNKY